MTKRRSSVVMKTWFVAVTSPPGGRRISLGRWPTKQLADNARLSAGRFLGLPILTNRAKRLGVRGVDPVIVRRQARQLVRKQVLSSKYEGVSRSKRGKWRAFVHHQGRKHYLGEFDTEKEAARARDLVARWFDPRCRLEVPGAPVVAVSPAQLRRERRARLKETTSSRYLGVAHRVGRDARPWVAQLGLGRRLTNLGRWRTQEDAARAYDRGAMHYLGPRANLNFPKTSKLVTPASATQLQAEAWAELKLTRTSRYRGVHWSKARRRWVASIKHDGRCEYLGYYAGEEEAAEAFDHAARRIRGKGAKLNFP